MRRSRFNIYLQHAHGVRLGELAAMRGISKSSIVAAALSAYLSPEGADQRELFITRRLDRLTGQFDRLERDQTILIETLALFIRHYLTVSTSIPVAHQDAARAQGRVRFEQFIAQLARHLNRGSSLIRQLAEEPPEAPESPHGVDRPAKTPEAAESTS